MKIISYNINGIRSGIHKGFYEWIKKIQPDIICLQEIRALYQQINTSIFEKIGYYHYWHSSKKKGYSGVGILSKKKPFHVQYGIDIMSIDDEGRVLRFDLTLKNEKLSIINLYIPSGKNMEKRLKFKFFFMKNLLIYIKSIKINRSNLIICGDYNICHKNIDIHDPIRNKNISGFLIEERKWIDNLLKLGFIDSFRYFNKEINHYSWWDYRTRSREKNKGWRIDYFMVSKSLKKRMKKSYLLPEIKFSDHCPVVLDIDFN